MSTSTGDRERASGPATNADVRSCPECHKQFTRKEHLTRHLRSHTREKPFPCPICGKRFSRTDILNRHKSAHQPPPLEKASLVATASFRACVYCASARAKCSGNQPCQRCKERGIGCRYPMAKRRKTSSSSGEDKPLECSDPARGQFMNSTNLVTSEGASQEVHNQQASEQTPRSWTSEPFLPGPQSAGLDFSQPFSGDSMQQDLLSLNWLPLGESPFDDWDFGAESGFFDDGFLAPESFQTNHNVSNSMQIANSQAGPQVVQENNRQDGPPNFSPGSRGASTASPHGNMPHARPGAVGRLYVDGNGGRIGTSSGSYRSLSIDAQSELCASPRNQTYDEPTKLWISVETYKDVISKSSLSIKDSFNYDNINHFLRLYYEKFHELFPLIYAKDFGKSRDQWLLVLAAVAIGAQYDSSPTSRILSCELHKSLHDILESLDVDDGEHAPDPQEPAAQIYNIQARILNVLGMYHSSDKTLSRLAMLGRIELVSTCLRMGLLQPAENASILNQKPHWLAKQMCIRAGYLIWVIDGVMAYESDLRPQMQLSDAQAPLPCSDVLWDDVEIHWSAITDRKNAPPTLPIAIDVLYKNRKILPNISEFGRMLLIQAIIRRTWEVTSYYRHPLSSWTPTAGSASDGPEETWVHTVSRWRNIACDALDVLHWGANSVIAKNAGYEHPIVLHLHLARLLLLTPIAAIQDLASSLLTKTDVRGSPNSRTESESRGEILRWIVQDEFKARLALIHAGATFWNIRRYSFGSPLEPFAIYLSSLIIWAYGTAKRWANDRKSLKERDHVQSAPAGHGPATNETQPFPAQDASSAAQANERPPSPSPELEFLHLDRPIDDELVQIFVRLGHKMTAYMVPVGDISKPGAGEKVLREGGSLLSGLLGPGEKKIAAPKMDWTIAETYKARLEKLSCLVQAADL